MIDEEQIENYTSKLKRYLINPSNAGEVYELYKADHSEAKFEDYTKALDDLVSKLEEGKIEDQAELCKEIKELKLPHNQFGC